MKLLKICLTLVSLPLFAQKSTVDLVYDDLASGALDSATAVQTLQSWLHGENVPANYVSDVPVKCGTFVLQPLESFTKRNPELKKTLQKASQTFYNHVFTSKGQNKTFRIHYDTTGVHAVPSEDLNGNQLRDWVEETGKAFERSYRLQVDTLGYKEPLNFTRAPFYYPVYIEDLNSDYGYTAGLDQVSTSPETWTTEIYVENDYVENGYATHGYDALRVTCAHEFLHAIQFSIAFRSQDIWYYETSSTWMEDVTYDEVNDYYAYIPALFDNPQSPMTSFGVAYAMCVWNHMIEKKYGRAAIRRSWENMATMTSLPAINEAIQNASNSNLAQNFSDFARWNFFTADRADTILHYPEGAFYPRVRSVVKAELRDTVFQRSLGNLAAHYFDFYATDSATCVINFSHNSASIFNILTIEFNEVTGKKFFENHGAATKITIDNLVPGDSLTVIVANTTVSTSPAATPYGLSIFLTDEEPVNEPFSGFYMYPSPYRPKPQNPADDGSLKLKFKLQKTSRLELEIYSLTGKRIARRDFGQVFPGSYDGAFDSRFRWNGTDDDSRISVPSGVYFYVLKGDGFKRTGKIAVVR